MTNTQNFTFIYFPFAAIKLINVICHLIEVFHGSHLINLTNCNSTRIIGG